MNLLMIRHGEIPSNVNKVYAGRSPESLTRSGVLQAIQASEKLKGYKIDALYSSPIQRALETAQIIAEKVGVDLRVDGSFRELEMGPWEGMSEDDVARLYPNEWSVWSHKPAELKLPGRETLDELLARVLAGIRNLYQDDPANNTVIVTHVAIIRVLLLWHERMSLNLYKTIHVPNAKVFEIVLDKLPLFNTP
ncbi:MAG: histidine phosphatase family protein [Nitrospirae bacterium]|nr:histidine phosphatase family protein [Nitrospirota bacterium]